MIDLPRAEPTLRYSQSKYRAYGINLDTHSKDAALRLLRFCTRGPNFTDQSTEGSKSIWLFSRLQVCSCGWLGIIVYLPRAEPTLRYSQSKYRAYGINLDTHSKDAALRLLRFCTRGPNFTDQSTKSICLFSRLQVCFGVIMAHVVGWES